MAQGLAAVVMLLAAAPAAAADTDFGVRSVGGAPAPREIFAPSTSVSTPRGRSGFNISAVASFGSQYGRVTSTYRSPSHNRAVGGVANSWHLSGRAVDIVRRSGVSHAALASAFRAQGYALIESLDEGDHSHFAFGNGLGLGSRVPQGSSLGGRIIYAPNTKEPLDGALSFRVVSSSGTAAR